MNIWISKACFLLVVGAGLVVVVLLDMVVVLVDMVVVVDLVVLLEKLLQVQVKVMPLMHSSSSSCEVC